MVGDRESTMNRGNPRTLIRAIALLGVVIAAGIPVLAQAGHGSSFGGSGGGHSGAGFAWFLPILPLGYATFWWGGIPYYYCNDAYYTWRPDYDGYVVTDPPPVAESASGDDSGDDSQSGGTADVYIYPRNGQSDEQTSNDRFECHKWAVGQTGFDPTRSSQTSGTASEYRRAMIACLGARGYSAK